MCDLHTTNNKEATTSNSSADWCYSNPENIRVRVPRRCQTQYHSSPFSMCCVHSHELHAQLMQMAAARPPSPATVPGLRSMKPPVHRTGSTGTHGSWCSGRFPVHDPVHSWCSCAEKPSTQQALAKKKLCTYTSDLMPDGA